MKTRDETEGKYGAHLEINAGHYTERQRHGVVVVNRHHLFLLSEAQSAQLVHVNDHIAVGVALLSAVSLHNVQLVRVFFSTPLKKK